MSRIIIYAPNIHTGGGIILLQALLSEWPKDKPLFLFLDFRVSQSLQLPPLVIVKWVKPTLFSRLNAEINLTLVSVAGSVVFCFHGLPPIFPNAGRIIVYQQNRNYLGLNSVFQFSFRTGLRLAFERLISKLFRYRVHEYIVQTPSMLRALLKWYGKSKKRMPLFTVFPFIAHIHFYESQQDSKFDWDFVYVSDGEAHKNHKNLLKAWILLANDGLYPSLALTLSSRDGPLRIEIAKMSEKYNLKIFNLGSMAHKEILALYNRSKALIFPSTSESFGLPLIEASRFGLPVLASELDYVRDVCDPIETFDPNSPVSIARAVKRFLKELDAKIEIQTPEKLWETLLGNPF